MKILHQSTQTGGTNLNMPTLKKSWPGNFPKWEVGALLSTKSLRRLCADLEGENEVFKIDMANQLVIFFLA